MSDTERTVDIKTPTLVAPGDTAQMTARFLHGGTIVSVHLDEGVGFVSLLAKDKRIELEPGEGAEKLADRLGEIGIMPNRSYAILVVQNVGVEPTILTGSLVIRGETAAEEKPAVLATTAAPEPSASNGAREPRVVLVDPHESQARPRTVTATKAGGSGQVTRTVPVKQATRGAQRVETGGVIRTKRRVDLAGARRVSTTSSVRRTDAVREFEQKEAEAGSAEASTGS